jgi:hypothetical protein
MAITPSLRSRQMLIACEAEFMQLGCHGPAAGNHGALANLIIRMIVRNFTAARANPPDASASAPST